MPSFSFGQDEPREDNSVVMKKLSMEELMNMEVTSVSKRPEKLAEVASAIQVITHDDIKRSGATSIPEALRLSPNLQVAQVSASAWIISARGFNAPFSNKLLVLIDGRTVYSPLFAGVFWDIQSVLLEDVERIEVISGPGGTLWGANAVNGVINIITKNTKDTQGLYASAAAGSFLNAFGGLRYGGKIGSRYTYRAYAQHSDRANTFLPNGNDNPDSWNLSQAGFSMDWQASEADQVMVQGNVYNSTQKTLPTESTADGQNILGRWSHAFSQKSGLVLQAYADRTWRHDVPSTINDQLHTYDIDVQHRFSLFQHHSILWGAGYRLMQNETQNSTLFVGLLPKDRTMILYSGFVQDEISLVPDRFKVTLGTKIQHNVYSKFEVQPSARVAWTPTAKQTIWAAVSRAVRMPSRIDVDYHLPAYEIPIGSPGVAGGPGFTSEKVVAYEAGYRLQTTSTLSLSLAGFYNRYNDLYSVESVQNTPTYQIQNGGEGFSYGAEFSGVYQPVSMWRLRGGYTMFHKELKNKPGHNADYASLGLDPSSQFLLQSSLDVGHNFQVDIIGRYADTLPLTSFSAEVPAYLAMDARIAWNYRHFEIAVVGKNLTMDRHPEYGSSQIPRNFYGKITCRF